jgi:hypothetical protein
MMDPKLQRALNEVLAALSPLPEGYTVEGGPNGSILVGSKYPEPDGLGFAITAQSIADGLHVEEAIANFGQLMRLVETGGRSDGTNTSFLQ